MDLREFVKETLAAIASGVKDAQDQSEQSGATVNAPHAAARSVPRKRPPVGPARRSRSSQTIEETARLRPSSTLVRIENADPLHRRSLHLTATCQWQDSTLTERPFHRVEAGSQQARSSIRSNSAEKPRTIGWESSSDSTVSRPRQLLCTHATKNPRRLPKRRAPGRALKQYAMLPLLVWSIRLLCASLGTIGYQWERLAGFITAAVDADLPALHRLAAGTPSHLWLG